MSLPRRLKYPAALRKFDTLERHAGKRRVRHVDRYRLKPRSPRIFTLFDTHYYAMSLLTFISVEVGAL